MEEVIQEQPKIVDWVYREGATVVLSSHQFQIISQVLRMFEMPLAILNSQRDRLINEKMLVPVYETDVDKQGNQYVLKPDFWDKNKLEPEEQLVSKPPFIKEPKLEIVK